MDRKVTFILFGILIGIALGLSILELLPSRGSAIPSAPSLTEDQDDQQQELVSGSLINNLAPEFTLMTLDGQQIRVDEFRGRYGLINFWATWCAPCLNELPVFQSRYQSSISDDFFILAVNAGEPRERIQVFLNDLNLAFPILLDPESEVQQMYQVKGFPVSYILDREGIIRFIHYGELTAPQLEEYLSKVGF
jgi:peroxiredoxin